MAQRRDLSTTDTAVPFRADDGVTAPAGATIELAAPGLQDPFFKRPLDVVVALVGLVLSAPIWLAVTLAVKLHRDGSILYRQQRWGRGGRPFTLYKFRTMVAHSDDHFGIRQAAEDDERVTPMGRVLRSTGIDELPQLINILRGDMSLVGPRPLAVGEVVPGGSGGAYEELPTFAARLSVRPGLTGPATVYLPRDAGPEEKFEFDLGYIEHQSLWIDVRLIALSLWISVRGKWEARGKKY